MKVQELFEDRKRQEKLDAQQLRRDYMRWKRLINMPTKLVRIMAGEDSVTVRGLSPRELQKRYGFTMPKNAAKAVLRLRSLPISQWATPEINWMYRMLRYVEKKRGQRIALVGKDGATEQLKDLWAWGHIPRNLRPNSKNLREGVELFDDEAKEKYEQWKKLVNMPSDTLEKFLDSETGQQAGLKRSEAAKLGIGTGRDSARAILRMRKKPFSEWNENDIAWMKRQISFISRMSGNPGPLFIEKDGKKIPTRKLTSLWIWGHIPDGHSPGKYGIL